MIVDKSFIADLAGLNHVGRYTITRELGRGGMAVVFLGRDPYIQRPVAIKMARPKSQEEKGHFFMEAQSAGRLSHPNIVTVYDAGVHESFCYIAMEFVAGKTLDAFCSRPHLLSPKKALEIGFSLAKALDYAHKKGVIHRDVKPGNVLLDEEQTPKITDFGIARISGGQTLKAIRGTPSYMSPEQLTGEKIAENTDVFSLGCVLYELLVGGQAFGGKDYPEIMRKVVREDPPKPSTIRPDLPPIIDDILARALAKKPQDRYVSCLDMGFDLRVALRGMKKDDIPDRKPKQALEYLQYIPFFNDFTPKQIEQLYLASDIDKAKKDSVIITEGDIDDTFYIVLSGTVRIEKEGRVIAKVGVGECFGEMAYIGGQARTATVKADTDCLLMRISATLLDRAPGPIQLLFFRNFSRFLVERFSLLFKKPAR